MAYKEVDFTYNADGQFDTIDRYNDLAGTELVAGSTYGYDADGQFISASYVNPSAHEPQATTRYETHSAGRLRFWHARKRFCAGVTDTRQSQKVP